MKAQDFDAAFDEGQDITDHLDMDSARRPARETRRVNVDFPAWMVEALDEEAQRLGITRQSLIKVWLADRLEQRKGFAA
jgi:predicted DNA binding CopG/RHH family protein